MSACRTNKRKHSCGCTKQNAICVYYDGYLPEYSKLKEEGCVTLEETTEELYTKQEEILNDIDLKDIGKSCIDFRPYQEKVDKLNVKEAIKGLEAEICNLKNCKGGDLSNFDISKIDPKCLDDKCNKSINSLETLLQKIIDELCNIKSVIDEKDLWSGG